MRNALFCVLTATIPEEQLLTCGAADCGLDISVNSTSTRPAQELVWTLVGSYIGVGVLAMLIVAVFLDNIDREQSSRFRGNREPFCQTFLATFRLLKDWRLVTLIPLTMYSGFEQSFLSGEYTKVRGSPTHDQGLINTRWQTDFWESLP
ncbi:protein unc-93 homolog A-like, partial [Etheostoma spectabile]|uniref:protein unc-93 homolog A-like n=1 Tax=Etheostoma spectabile TaxID=54343 RepID=UPI0013AEA327